MSGCSLLQPDPIKIQTKQTLPEPTYLEDVAPPSLSDYQIIVTTAQDAQYYQDACEAFTEDADKAKEVYVGLTYQSSCNWSVWGFTVQEWMNLQQDLILIDNYVERLEEQRDFYKRQLENRYNANKSQ